MKLPDAIFSPTSLMCNEDPASLEEEYQEKDESFEDGDDDEDEYIQTLLEKEKPSCLLSEQDFSDRYWLQEARSDAIKYILRRRAFLGFKDRTVYLAVAYVDMYLSKKFISEDQYWVVQLLSITSLSLAAKIEETSVPALSHYFADGYGFENREVHRMELLVLDTFEWRMTIVTPFAFTRFFSEKFFDKSPQRNNVSSRILQVITTTIHDWKIMRHRPSVIAASATLVVLDPNLTREALELKLGPLNGALSIEDVGSCYNQVKEIERSKSEIKSPGLSPIQLLGTDAYSGGAGTSVTNATRKRLEYDKSDDDDDGMVTKKIK